MRSALQHAWAEPRFRWAAVAAVLVVVAVIAVLVVVWPTHRAGVALGDDPLAVDTHLSTTSTVFGDTVMASVSVLSDDRRVDPGSVAVTARFAPYKVVSTRTTRSTHGNVSLLRSSFTLRCLTSQCLPPPGGASVGFAPAEVAYRLDGAQSSGGAPWPELLVYSRLGTGPAGERRVADDQPPLDPDTARSPTMLRLGLGLIALVCGLGGALLLAQGLWPRFGYSLRGWRKLDPLERSLTQVEAAAVVDDEALRRTVLDQLATQLGEEQQTALARQVRERAWAASPPESDDLTDLADEVRGQVRAGNGAHP